MFKLNRPLPAYTGFKTKTPTPLPPMEPKKEPTHKPLKTDGLEGDHLRVTKIVNWTSGQLYNQENPIMSDRQKNEIVTLTQLAVEYLQAGDPAGRVIGKLENTIQSIDPDFKTV